VLAVSVRRGLREWRKLATKQADLERTNEQMRKEIGARDAMEVELRHEQKLSSMGRLAAGVAHELNTPTQYVVGSATFLQESSAQIVSALQAGGHDELAGDVTSAIDDTVEGTGRIAAIVRSMKDFSHPSKGKKSMVALRSAVETTTSVCRNEWKNVADVVVAIDEALPPVPALRDELNQVVLNMIVNATHSIGERHRGLRRGRIEIGAAVVDGTHMELRIADDGAGIPAAIRERIFEPFFTTKPVGKGTGQGLAIAWAVVVEKHSGTLSVTSEEGVGTTFVIRLPLRDEQLEADVRKEARLAGLPRTEHVVTIPA
jgi:two-component system NtrC family sensor kinase